MGSTAHSADLALPPSLPPSTDIPSVFAPNILIPNVLYLPSISAVLMLSFIHATPLCLYLAPPLIRTPFNSVSKRYRPRQTLCSSPPSHHQHIPSDDINGTFDSNRAPPPRTTPDSDRKALEDLASRGVSSLNTLGEQATTDLESVSDATAAYADSLISEETDALLERYDMKQRELMIDVDRQRQVIQEEMEHISRLVKEEGRRKRSNIGQISKRALLYGVNCMCFGVAAFSTMVKGIVKEDVGEMGYSGVLVGLAVVCGVLLRREKVKERAQKEGREGKR